ncbi:MAG: Gfo/Idh/MocA family oxidoreductase [Nitrosopumilus sp.]|uniref:Gfo/Idh/MocA family protein n=1 Tax=Nitrosopumilus sp. TaxID=2024843 RepID=UPI00247C8212|nr:Gfo/Idh/MocA family oxidoreductase [Nitrosopumilus sp.]MCV0393570.1 Gfo/Idh/MocA family oxidoreductase [Nitrosopumilus sp.]
MNNPSHSYDLLTNLSSLDFKDKSILLIGSGYMGEHYANALSSMGITNVTIFSRTAEKAKQISQKYGFEFYFGDLEDFLKGKSEADLTIIATSIASLLPTAKKAMEYGQKNILIEKPGSLYYQELLKLNDIVHDQKLRIGYNRLVYPNLHKLKKLVAVEGGITSCNFNFTEFVHTIDFQKEEKLAYERWGISNSLHVISMVLDLIGMPKEYLFYQSGKLDWHPSGSVFVGSGLSEFEIPFSYHADWGSSGRWGIEIMTNQSAYRLISLEELWICPKKTIQWQKIDFDQSYPNVKQGLAEQIAIMLDENIEEQIPLVTLNKAAKFNQIAEKICGYEQ